MGTCTLLGLQLGTGTSAQSCHRATLHTGRTSVTQDTELRAVQVNLVASLVLVTGPGSWYHTPSALSRQLISGTMKVTSLATKSHSCQVTGSQLARDVKQ